MSGIWLAALVALWIVVILMAFLLAGALREIGLIALRLGDDPGALITDFGLERGDMIPRITGVDADSGEVISIDAVGDGPRVFTFISPSCLACRTLIPHLNEVIATRPEFNYVTVCRGDRESCAALKHSERLRSAMIVDDSGAIEHAFDIRLTPFAYLTDADGRVLLRGVVNDWRQLEALLDQEGTIQTSPWHLVEQPLAGA